MAYNRVPQDFLKGVFLKPYSFSDPQNPQHGEYVNMQLRNDLYYSALDEISKIEFSQFGNEDEWIKVEEIKQCKGPDPSYWLVQQYKKKKGRVPKGKDENFVDAVSCEDWKVACHRGDTKTQSIYRVKILQTKTDIFRSHIYPPTFSKIIKDLLIN